MADLDRDLSSRLSRLAEAVPVGRGRLDPVHATAVTARRSVRLAWVTPLVVLAAGVLVAGVLQVGPFAPLESHSPGSAGADRWKSTVTEGDFELTLAAAKGTFSADEPLDVIASLTYLGREEQITIHHLKWGPLEFGMWAPGITLIPRGRWSCSDLEMTRGVPITEPLMNLNGGTRFAVPHGLREITASAQFSRGSCSAPPDAMETSITVAVADGPDDIPLFTDEASEVTVCLLMRNGGRLTPSNTGLGVVSSDGILRDVVWPVGYTARRTADGAVLLDREGEAIAREGEEVSFDALTPRDDGPLWPCDDVVGVGKIATPAPSPTADPPVVAIDSEGPYLLELRSVRPTYHESDVIAITGAFTYSGSSVVATAGFKGTVFSVHEPINGLVLSGISTMECNYGTLKPGERFVRPFYKSGAVSMSDPRHELQLAYLKDPAFRLPPGTWHVAVRTVLYEDDCIAGREINLSTSIEIVVLPD